MRRREKKRETWSRIGMVEERKGGREGDNKIENIKKKNIHKYQ